LKKKLGKVFQRGGSVTTNNGYAMFNNDVETTITKRLAEKEFWDPRITVSDLMITSNINHIDDQAFRDGTNRHQIRKLIFENGVKTIGTDSFYNNNISEELILPESLYQIGSTAFQNNEIKNLTIPNSVKEIGENAFQKNRITKVTMPLRFKDKIPIIFGNDIQLLEDGYYHNNTLEGRPVVEFTFTEDIQTPIESNTYEDDEENDEENDEESGPPPPSFDESRQQII